MIATGVLVTARVLSLGPRRSPAVDHGGAIGFAYASSLAKQAATPRLGSCVAVRSRGLYHTRPKYGLALPTKMAVLNEPPRGLAPHGSCLVTKSR